MFFNQLTFPLPHLQTFLSAAENIKLSSAKLIFWRNIVSVSVYPRKGARTYSLNMNVGCGHLDWQVASLAQILSVLRTALSTVEDITLESRGRNMSSEWREEADHTQWRDLLGSFGNVKTLRVRTGLVRKLARSLRSDDGESPVELLPELKELSYSPLCDINAFTSFIDARCIAGRPVTLVRR